MLEHLAHLVWTLVHHVTWLHESAAQAAGNTVRLTKFGLDPRGSCDLAAWVSSPSSIGANSSGGTSGAKARAASWRTAM